MSSNFLNNELKLQVKDIALEDSIDEEKAFTHWVCDKILDIPQDEIEDALKIQEAPEHNISIFHKDDEEEVFIIARTIYDPTGNVTLSEQEITKLFESLDRLKARDYRENQIFKEKSEDYVAYLTRNYRTQVIIAITGNLESRVQKAISNKESLLVDSDVDFQVYTINSLEDVVKDPRTQELAIKFKRDETFQRHGHVGNSITGTVDATEIVRIYEENRYRLFSLNPRESLKNTTVNKEILETLKSSIKREKFWEYNNGINATCDDFKESDTEVGKFIFQNFKIVNGRQTTGSLYQANRKGWLDSSVQVLLRVNATTNQEEREGISRATNTQNQIKWSDIISSRKEIRKLSLEISRYYPKFYYETQRGGYNNLDDAGKKLILKNGVIEKEKAVRCYISYSLERPYDSIQKSQ
ncbi:MAG: AIPR family protein, partial [Patescibacteria group bacterium]|nr:AIPR family protein [Patescibacteria group bacterium]